MALILKVDFKSSQIVEMGMCMEKYGFYSSVEKRGQRKIFHVYIKLYCFHRLSKFCGRTHFGSQSMLEKVTTRGGSPNIFDQRNK